LRNKINALTSLDGNLFAGTENSGVFHSADNGENWTQCGMTGISVFAFTISSGYLFASSLGSVWRRPLSEMITSSVPSSNQPSAFHLAQNYPNPFTESTALSFDLPERAFVSLKVYDITGREVAVLANESLDAGSYTKTFEAERIPSGTYICHLEAGAYRQERTLFLLR
jgi:hypothetical protein